MLSRCNGNSFFGMVLDEPFPYDLRSGALGVDWKLDCSHGRAQWIDL